MTRDSIIQDMRAFCYGGVCACVVLLFASPSVAQVGPYPPLAQGVQVLPAPYVGGSGVPSGPIFATVGVDCTAGTIPYSFSGDTDTGMTSVAANTLTWCLGGTSRLTLTGSGALAVSGNLTAVNGNIYNGGGPEWLLTNGGAGVFQFDNAAGTTGVNMDVSVDALAHFKTRGSVDTAILRAFTLKTTAGVLFTGTAPSGPVACTSPTVTNSNGSAAFQIDVGSTCGGVSTLVVTLPAATNAWAGCTATHVNSPATRVVALTGSTTTSVTFTNYSRTLGTAADWADGDDVRVGGCIGG